ncbi:hypothetical protein D3C72_1472230 [compost metagenome]
MLIILRLAVLPHKHPHELLDSVVKEQWLSLSSQPRRAFYSTPSFRQVVFRSSFREKFFLLNRLHLRSASGISLAGGEFYSVSNHCQPPLQPLSICPTEAPNRAKPPPCQSGAFYTACAASQSLFLIQPIVLQEVFREICTGRGAHYRPERNCVKPLFGF